MAAVLLVEDEVDIQRLLGFILKDVADSLLPVASLAEAREVVEREAIDLVLLDLWLPDGSGYEFLAELRRQAGTREIPIVVLTAHAQPEEQQRGLDLGATAVITKPFEPQALRKRVKTLLAAPN